MIIKCCFSFFEVVYKEKGKGPQAKAMKAKCLRTHHLLVVAVVAERKQCVWHKHNAKKERKLIEVGVEVEEGFPKRSYGRRSQLWQWPSSYNLVFHNVLFDPTSLVSPFSYTCQLNSPCYFLLVFCSVPKLGDHFFLTVRLSLNCKKL